ncbi:hypothetical protein [Actinokineospora inagensis]|uniref:hypothetical protein n=1 Tax=Actinokineospora inagensis TaxID=103730 RepID=UPI0004024538|nr:hypothetical protein [Actinokineospora inagensis]
MRRLSRIAATAVLAVLLGLLLQPATASADKLGGLLVTPGESVDLVPMRLKTDKGCPAGATGYLATINGHGLDNVIVVPTSDVLLSHTQGFMVPVANTLHDYAEDNHTTLQGRYDVTLKCIDAFSQQDFGDFTASIDIPAAGRYAAVGAAKGPPRNTEPIIPPELGLSTEAGPPPAQQAPQSGQAQPPAQQQQQAQQQPAEQQQADNAAASSGSKSQPFLYLAAGVVVILVIAGVVTVVRRRGTRSTESETE